MLQQILDQMNRANRASKMIAQISFKIITGHTLISTAPPFSAAIFIAPIRQSFNKLGITFRYTLLNARLISPSHQLRIRILSDLRRLRSHYNLRESHLEWIALDAIAPDATSLGINFPQLIQQAERQLKNLEPYRIEYAKSAFRTHYN